MAKAWQPKTLFMQMSTSNLVLAGLWALITFKPTLKSMWLFSDLAWDLICRCSCTTGRGSIQNTGSPRLLGGGVYLNGLNLFFFQWRTPSSNSVMSRCFSVRRVSGEAVALLNPHHSVRLERHKTQSVTWGLVFPENPGDTYLHWTELGSKGVLGNYWEWPARTVLLLPPLPSLCLGDQYLRDHLHKNIINRWLETSESHEQDLKQAPFRRLISALKICYRFGTSLHGFAEIIWL